VLSDFVMFGISVLLSAWRRIRGDIHSCCISASVFFMYGTAMAYFILVFDHVLAISINGGSYSAAAVFDLAMVMINVSAAYGGERHY